MEIPSTDLRWRFSRASGPGGQSVNTTDSRVELSFDLAASEALPVTQWERALTALHDRLVDGVVTVVAAEHRSERARGIARRGLDLHNVGAPVREQPAGRGARDPHPELYDVHTLERSTHMGGGV